WGGEVMGKLAGGGPGRNSPVRRRSRWTGWAAVYLSVGGVWRTKASRIFDARAEVGNCEKHLGPVGLVEGDVREAAFLESEQRLCKDRHGFDQDEDVATELRVLAAEALGRALVREKRGGLLPTRAGHLRQAFPVRRRQEPEREPERKNTGVIRFVHRSFPRAGLRPLRAARLRRRPRPRRLHSLWMGEERT